MVKILVQQTRLLRFQIQLSLQTARIMRHAIFYWLLVFARATSGRFAKLKSHKTEI